MNWPAKVRRIVAERSEGICEGCGRRPASNLHHRKYKSRLGEDTVDNALALCGLGNIQTAGCHGVAHSGEGHELGWSCNTWETPAEKPVLYRGRLVYLTPTGETTPAN